MLGGDDYLVEWRDRGTTLWIKEREHVNIDQAKFAAQQCEIQGHESRIIDKFGFIIR